MGRVLALILLVNVLCVGFLWILKPSDRERWARVLAAAIVPLLAAAAWYLWSRREGVRKDTKDGRY